jgi:hypothetical protein
MDGSVEMFCLYINICRFVLKRLAEMQLCVFVFVCSVGDLFVFVCSVGDLLCV